MAREIKVRTDRASSPVGLILVGLAFLAIFLFIKRDSSKNGRTAPERQEPTPAKTDADEEEYPRYRFVNYTPEPPSPSPTRDTNVPGLLRKENGEYQRKTVEMVNDGKPTDVQNFYDLVGSRTRGQQLDHVPERDTKYPERETYNKLVIETRGKGWHGEPIGAVSVHLLEKEGLLQRDIIDNMRIMEDLSQPRPALYKSTDSEGDNDVYVYPWGNIPGTVRDMLVRFNELKFFDIPNLAMLMWNVAPKGEIHWIRDHPLIPLENAVKEAAEWRSRNSTDAGHYAVADPAHQVNLLLGWFVLPYHGCGHHGPAEKSPYHKLESWAATAKYTYLPNSLREGISRKEYLLLVWLAWLGRRWMMKRAFKPRGADLLDGSLRLAILPNTADGDIPDLRLDVTLFLPTEFNCCTLDQPAALRAWTIPNFMLWALNRVMFEARPYIEDVTQSNDKLSEGSYRVPYVRFVRLFLRPGVAAAERMRGTMVSSSTGGNWDKRPFPRPPRLVVRVESDRIARFLNSRPGYDVKNALKTLVMHLRPQRIEFSNIREYHQVDLPNVHSNNHDGSAIFIVMLSISNAIEKIRERREVDGVAVDITDYNMEYRPFNNDPYAKAVMPEDQLIALRHMWIDFGGVLPLSMTQDRLGKFAWPFKLKTALYFTLPLLDKIDSEPKKNQPSTGQVILDPRYGILESLTLADPCTYLVFFAPDPTLEQGNLESRIRLDEMRFWSQLRENFVYGLHKIMSPEPEGETPQARADRALAGYKKLERLLNDRVHIAVGREWQPNNIDPTARHLAFEYFDGHLSDEEKKVKLLSSLGDAKSTTLSLDADFVPADLDFGGWDYQGGNSPINRFGHVTSPGFSDKESDEESEIDFTEDYESTAEELLKLRQQYTADLVWIAHHNWEKYIIEAQDFLANALSLAAVQEMLQRVAERVEMVEKEGFRHYQDLFIKKCKNVADSKSCDLPKDYDKIDAAWSGEPLHAARQIVKKQYISQVKRNVAAARNRLQPNLRDAKKILRGELQEDIARCLAGGIKDSASFETYCHDALDRHRKSLFGQPVTDENAAAYKAWWTSDKQGDRINNALANVCEDALTDFENGFDALADTKAAQACSVLRTETDQILDRTSQDPKASLTAAPQQSKHRDTFINAIKNASIEVHANFRKDLERAKGRESDAWLESGAGRAFQQRFKEISTEAGRRFDALLGSLQSEDERSKQGARGQHGGHSGGRESTQDSYSTVLQSLELSISQAFSSMAAMLTSKIQDFGNLDITSEKIKSMPSDIKAAREWHQEQVLNTEYNNALLGDVLAQYDLHSELLASGKEDRLANRKALWNHLIERFDAEVGAKVDKHWSNVEEMHRLREVRDDHGKRGHKPGSSTTPPPLGTEPAGERRGQQGGREEIGAAGGNSEVRDDQRRALDAAISLIEINLKAEIKIRAKAFYEQLKNSVADGKTDTSQLLQEANVSFRIISQAAYDSAFDELRDSYALESTEDDWLGTAFGTKCDEDLAKVADAAEEKFDRDCGVVLDRHNEWLAQQQGRGGNGDKALESKPMSQEELNDALAALQQAKAKLLGQLLLGWKSADLDADKQRQEGTLTDDTLSSIKDHYLANWQRSIHDWAQQQQQDAATEAVRAHRAPPWGSMASTTWTAEALAKLLEQNDMCAARFAEKMKIKRRPAESAETSTDQNIALATQNTLADMTQQLEQSLGRAEQELQDRLRTLEADEPDASDRAMEEWLKRWRQAQGKLLEDTVQLLYRKIGAEYGVDATRWAQSEAGQRFISASKDVYKTFSARARERGTIIVGEVVAKADRVPTDERNLCKKSLNALESGLLGSFNKSMTALKKSMRTSKAELKGLLQTAHGEYTSEAEEVLRNETARLHEQIKNKVMVPADWVKTQQGRNWKQDADKMLTHYIQRFGTQGESMRQTLYRAKGRAGGPAFQQ